MRAAEIVKSPQFLNLDRANLRRGSRARRRNRAQNGQLPEFPKSSFFSVRRLCFSICSFLAKIHPTLPSLSPFVTAMSPLGRKSAQNGHGNLPNLSPFLSPALTRQPAERSKRLPGLKILAILNQR